MLTSWVMNDKVLLLSTLLCFLSLLQFIAVLFAVGGIVLFAYEDSFGSAGWLGVLLSLGSIVVSRNGLGAYSKPHLQLQEVCLHIGKQRLLDQGH